MYNFLRFIETELKADVIEVKNTYIINGSIHVHKNKVCVHDIITNERKDIYSPIERAVWILEKVKLYPANHKFKNTSSSKDSFPEDYQWERNVSKRSASTLYFLVHRDTVKIGTSLSPKDRIRNMQTSLSDENTAYLFDQKGFLERPLHRCFAEFNINRELFSYNERIERFLTKYHFGEKLN